MERPGREHETSRGRQVAAACSGAAEWGLVSSKGNAMRSKNTKPRANQLDDRTVLPPTCLRTPALNVTRSVS